MPGFLQFLAKTKYDTEIVCDNYEAPVEIRNEDGKVLVMHDELIEVIHELTDAATAKGLIKPTVSMFDLMDEGEPAPTLTAPPFHPLPENANAAVVICGAFVTSDGVERHGVAYVNDDGILILKAIGNERNSIEYAQFCTDDLRAMLALKENTR